MKVFVKYLISAIIGNNKNKLNLNHIQNHFYAVSCLVLVRRFCSIRTKPVVKPLV